MLIVVGLGKKSEFNLEVARQAAGTAALKLQLIGVESASSVVHGAGEGRIDAEAAAQHAERVRVKRRLEPGAAEAVVPQQQSGMMATVMGGTAPGGGAGGDSDTSEE